jgi:hypothetical protein
VLIEDAGDGHFTSPSTWVLLARDAAILDIPAIRERAAERPQGSPSVRLWTDDYSNLFQLLKR